MIIPAFENGGILQSHVPLQTEYHMKNMWCIQNTWYENAPTKPSHSPRMSRGGVGIQPTKLPCPPAGHDRNFSPNWSQ